MKIFLTGGTGFLGSKILKMLVEHDDSVVCLKRKSSNMARVVEIQEKCSWVDSDELDFENLFEVEKFDAVIHCATNYGRGQEDCFSTVCTDLCFSIDLLHLASNYNVPFFINTDTCFSRNLCGNIGGDVYLWNYTASKTFFVEFARHNAEKINCAFVNMCLEHVYGADDGKGKFVDFIFESLCTNVASIELSEGLQKRDWIFVDDVVDAFETILLNKDNFKKGTFFSLEVGTGVATSVADFVGMVKRMSESTTRLDFGKKQMAKGELMFSVADNKNLVKLGWKPQYSLEDGIKKILENRSVKK